MDFNSSSVCCSNASTIYIEDSQVASEMLYTSMDISFHLVIVPCLMAIGFFTNASFLYTIWRSSELQTVTNAYLTNVAIADLIFIGVNGIFLYVLPSIHSPVKIDNGMGILECKFVNGIMSMCFYASITLISTVAVEKYVAVCHPLYQRTVSSKSRTAKMISLAWILGAVLSVLFLSRASSSTSCIIWPPEYSSLPNEIVTCSLLPESVYFPYLPLVDSFIFTTCLMLNVTMYAKIILSLRRRAASNLGQGQAHREHNHVARLLTINGLVFFLCYTPLQCIYMDYIATIIFGDGIFSNAQLEQLYKMSSVFRYVNSSINLFVYISSSARYRNAYLKVLGLRSL